MAQALKNQAPGATAITYVPIRPHIIRRSDGTGGYSMASLNNVLALTNKYYLQNDNGIQFYFAGDTPDYIDNTTLYNQYRQNTDDATVAPRDVTNALNQYYVHAFNVSGLGGYAKFPENTVASTRTIILDEEDDIDMGNRLVPHELGHTFNLLHTHEPFYGRELVTRGAGANCTTAGDLVCDTPADPYGQFSGANSSCVSGCPTTYTCSFVDSQGNRYQPLPTNIMSYYFPCTHDFTTGQYDRIQGGLALRQTHTAYTLNAPPTSMAAPSNVVATTRSGGVLITWQDNSSNEMGYFIERSTDPTTGFLPIGGVGPNVTTYTDLLYASQTRYFYRIKASNSTNGSISTTANTLSPNCIPSFQYDGCPYNITITGVAVNGTTLSQNSGCSPASQGHFTLFTAVSGTVTAGQSVPFTVTKGTSYTMGGAIWVDLDNNGSFDANERLYQMPTTDKASTFSGTLAIPLSTTAPSVAMRIVAAYATIPSDPCGTYDYGETEEYRLIINQPCVPAVATLSGATTISTGQVVTLSASLTGSAPYSLTVTTSSGPPITFAGIAASPFTFTVTPAVSTTYSMANVANSCGQGTANGTAVVTVNCLPTVSVTTSGPITCAQTSVTLTASGGTSYTFTNGSGVLGTPGTTNTLVVTSIGSYSVTATNAGGCISTTSTTVTSNTVPPGVSINPSAQTVCQGKTATFTASGADAYTWNTGATTASISFVANASNTYSVTGTSTNNGCSATASSQLTVNAPLVATLTASPSAVLSCAQTSLTLTAGGGTGYTFSGPGIISQTGNQVVVNTPGTYSVSVTSSGCTSTTSIVISQDNTAPAASLVSSGGLSCSATSVTLTASPGGQTYRFSAGATPIGTTNQATVTTADIYSVTVLAGNGCSSVASTTVTGDQTASTVSINPGSATLTCANPSATLTAIGTGSFLWNTGAQTATITVTTGGTYSVTVTGSNGCVATASAEVSRDQTAPIVSISPTSGTLTCANPTLTLTANTSAQTIRWSNGQTTPSITVNTADTYSVTVTSTATGCSNTASTVVNQDNSQPTVSIDPTSATLTCGVPSVVLTATTMSGSLTWNTGQTTSSISVSVAGTYSVTVTSANGCMVMAQATVSGTTTAPTAPTLSANPSTSTTNQPITVTATGCTGGTINWTALGGSGQASGNTYTLAQPGNYTLSATCSLNGCTSGASAPLAVQIRPGGFAITGVSMVNCQLIDEARGQYQVQFTPQYAGQTNSPISFAVVNELAQTTAPAPYSLRLYTDNPVITLVATQAGNGEARFAYNWLASCQSGTSPNQPPTTTGIPAQTILVGQGYQLQLTSYFTDLDGQALSFQASGLPTGLTLNGSVISGAPSQTGVSTVNVTALDPGGLQVSTSFQLTVSPMPVTPPSGFAIVGVSTVSCQVLSAGQRRLTFTPQYAGVSGAPISFSVVNELVATTSPGPYSLNLYTDNPSITLSAQQGATVSTYRYNWLAVCTPAARVGSGEAGSHLLVRVLGNPVEGNTAEVEISGVMGQAVKINVVDLQGKPVHTHRIEQAGAVERVSLPLGASNGVLLLQVSTPTQRQQVKLVRTN